MNKKNGRRDLRSNNSHFCKAFKSYLLIGKSTDPVIMSKPPHREEEAASSGSETESESEEDEDTVSLNFADGAGAE